MKRFLSTLFCLPLLFSLCLLPSLSYAQLRAFLDKQQIQKGERVLLQVEIDERTQDEPDFRELAKDFALSQSGKSSSVRIVNGSMSATTQWQITLIPRRTGTLTIPSFSLAGQQTPELQLQVDDAGGSRSGSAQNSWQNPSQNSDPNGFAQRGLTKGSSKTQQSTQLENKPPVFVTLDLSNSNPYVQEPILATLNIYHSVNILQGGLSDWTPKNARVERLPDQSESSEVIDGKTYEITQVHYWITPQQSGPLELPSLVFQGDVIDMDNIMTTLGALTGRQRMTDATEPQTLQVKPQPANYPPNTPWLPAKNIRIEDSWMPSSQQVQVGQALTRNIKVQITGQWPSLIAQIQYPPQTALKFYPDQSAPEEKMTPDNLVGSKTLSIAMVPTQPGTLTLPAATLTWWNTNTNQLERTLIPGATLQVAPAPGQSMAAPTAAPKIPTQLSAPADLNQPANTSSNNNSLIAALPLWQWITLGLVFLWLLTLLIVVWLWRRRRSTTETTQEEEENSLPATTDALQNLQNALRNNDIAAIEHAVIEWGQAHFQNPYLLSLNQLQQQLQQSSQMNPASPNAQLAELNALLQQLSAQRYNPQQNNSAANIAFTNLLPLLKALSKTTSNKKPRKGAPLPELYPK